MWEFYLFFVFFALSGCSANSQNNKSEPVNLQVILKSDAQLNKNSEGISNPVKLIFYKFNQDDEFNSADYFSLQLQSDSGLISEVKKIASYIIVPDHERTIYLPLDSNIKKIGVVTAYQDIDRAHWRMIFDVPEKPERHWYNVMWSENKKWQPLVIIHLKNLDTSVE